MFLFAFPACLLRAMKHPCSNLLNTYLFPSSYRSVQWLVWEWRLWFPSCTCLFRLFFAARTGSLQTSFPRCPGQVTLPPGGTSRASEDRREGGAIPAQDSGGPSGPGGDSSCVTVAPLRVWLSIPARASRNHSSGKCYFSFCSSGLRGHSRSLQLLICACPHCSLAPPALPTPL